MNRLSLFSLVFCAASIVHAQEACKPVYEMTHAKCQSTGKVLGVEHTSLKTEVVNHGACNEPDGGWIALCREHVAAIIHDFPTATPESIIISNVKHKDADGMCGGFGHMHQKQDVSCDFDVQTPSVEMVAGEDCAIIDVVEKTGCVTKDSVVLSGETVQTCLSLRPKTDKEWWNKVACLSDLNQAAKSFATQGLTEESTKEIRRQVALAIDLTKPNPQLNSYITQRNR